MAAPANRYIKLVVGLISSKKLIAQLPSVETSLQNEYIASMVKK